MRQNEFIFSGVLLRQPSGFTALCIDLDVASEGRTPGQAKRRLSEAVTLHLETAFENNLPHLRPMPRADNPLCNNASNLVETFRIHIDFAVEAHV